MRALVVPFIVLQTGCGLLAQGTSRRIPVYSDPTGATVRVNGEEVGVTPVRVALNANRSHEVRVSAAGYEPETRLIHPDIEEAYIAADLLFTGLIGLGIDALTGGWSSLEPAVVRVSLNRAEANASATDSQSETDGNLVPPPIPPTHPPGY